MTQKEGISTLTVDIGTAYSSSTIEANNSISLSDRDFQTSLTE